MQAALVVIRQNFFVHDFGGVSRSSVDEEYLRLQGSLLLINAANINSFLPLDQVDSRRQASA
jgi:hypothetical protein